jgi:hypothetical protein
MEIVEEPHVRGVQKYLAIIIRLNQLEINTLLLGKYEVFSS